MRARMPPDCADPNHLVSRASMRRKNATDSEDGVCGAGNADTGSADDGGAGRGSAGTGGTGDGGAGGGNTAGGTGAVGAPGGADIFPQRLFSRFYGRRRF
jgi:hypothetical protein